MNPPKKAIIVAAGEGRRLLPLTEKIPKCFLPVGGRPLIEYSLDALRQCGVEEIAFVVGFLRDEFPVRLGGAYRYIYNPFYASTNNMASLWFAKEFIGGEGFVYLHSDVFYHPDILAMTLESQAEIALAVERKECDDEMMKVRVRENYLLESSKEIPLQDAYGEWTGIAKFTERGWQEYLKEVEKLLAEQKFDVYDTTAMNRLIQRARIVQIVTFQNLPFVEIDFPEDMKRAEELAHPARPSAHIPNTRVSG